MAGEGRGGYRKPSRPAAVSGPGSLSARTDGGPANPTQGAMVAPGGEYGSRKEMEAIQGSAPMQGGGGGTTPPPSPVPLDAPSQFPDQPGTAGAALGAGIGPEAAGIFSDAQGDLAALKPMLRSLEVMANLPGSNPTTRSFVRMLKAQMTE